MGSHIPFGQPILVGHHSARRARNTVRRINSAYDRSFESSQMADRHRSRAAGIAAQLEKSVYSDDVDAVQRLEGRIATRTAEVARIKLLNKRIRAEQKAGLQKGWLARIGATDAENADMMQNARRSTDGSPVYPSFKLTNLGASIRTDKKRLEKLGS